MLLARMKPFSNQRTLIKSVPTLSLLLFLFLLIGNLSAYKMRDSTDYQQTKINLRPIETSKNASVQQDSSNKNLIQPRLLTTCTIPGWKYCAIIDTEKCFFCESGKYLYPTLEVCANRAQVEINSIQVKNCTISKCASCVIFKLNSVPHEFCILCQLGYRSLPLENKCAPNDQFIDTQGIVSYGRYYFKCPEGCLTCSGYGTYTCLSCKKGYSLTSPTNYTIFTYCIKCYDNCQTCNASNPNQCLTCFTGFVLNAGSCLKCTGSSCSSCQTASLGTCTSCKNSLVLTGGSCQNCPANCKTCSTNSTCDACNQGYVLVTVQNGSTSCVKCIYGCYDCQSITTCRFCYPGHYQNSQNQCTPCGPNCRVCTSNQNCSSCHSGFDSFNGKCIRRIKNCYVLFQNGKCLACNKPFQISQSGQCDSDMGTSTPYNDTISTRGQCRTGYYEENKTCKSCSSRAPGCQVCSFSYYQSSSYNYSAFACDQCQNGYYFKKRLTDSTCYQCPQTDCKRCQSENVCLECNEGYFLVEDSNSANNSQTTSHGQCMKCDDNCKTCYMSSKMCTSCNGNYTLSLQNTCEGEYQMVFTMSFDFDYETAGQKLRVIRGGLADYLPKEAQIHQDLLDYIIKFIKIYKGSTVIQGYVDLPSQQAATQMHESVNQAITEGKPIGSLPVLSASFTVAKKSDKLMTEKGEEKNNLGLILGLAIGITCGIVVIGIAAFIIWKKANTGQFVVNGEGLNGQSGIKGNKEFAEFSVIDKGKLENSNYAFGN